ncbi:MAG: phosphoribosylanthranilate isomerase [Bacillota bacterium]
MSYVRVKICGISDVETAHRAAHCGADALGFVFAPSRRRVSTEKAGSIITELPPFISKVGVFVNQSYSEICHIVECTGIDTIQLHGDETPEFCRSFRHKVIKSLSVKEESDIASCKYYDVDAYLLDTSLPGMRGGTGISFDWRLATGFTHGPLILAGGLNPGNVREAIKTVRPYAVDVSSGVETDGKKDFYKIEEFIRRAKS